jgi:hypothetical protein
VIRPAKISDFDSCFRIASGFFEKYPHLRPNESSIKNLFYECVSGSRNFSLVSCVDGKIVGCLFALSFDHIWAQKQASSILIWSCEISGEGVALLRMYRQWIDSRPAIRVGGLQIDIDLAERVQHALEYCGFARKGGCFLRIKGGDK